VVEEFTRPLTAEYFHVQTGFTWCSLLELNTRNVSAATRLSVMTAVASEETHFMGAFETIT
jgi:hypothetical protein